MNYYNEFNAEAAAWLRQLIEEKLIPAGIVDTRSICDVTPTDLLGFAQCHFFAGIGGWPLALQRAGVEGDSQLWTGSCPCQPFTSAGQGRGQEDDRHLWPVFARLIAQCRPAIVLGEQVDSAIGHGWLDGVCADMEAEGYAVGAAVLPACGIGAPHRRNRLWWAGVLAENPNGGRCGRRGDADSAGHSREVQAAGLGDGRAVADTNQQRRNGIDALLRPERREDSQTAGIGADGSMVNGIKPGLEGHDRDGAGSDQPRRLSSDSAGSATATMRAGSMVNSEDGGIVGIMGDEISAYGSPCCGGEHEGMRRDEQPSTGHVAVYCADGKYRRVPTESLFQRVADGLSPDLDRMRDPRNGYPLCEKKAVAFRRQLLHGYGNAIHPDIAAVWVKAVIGSD